MQSLDGTSEALAKAMRELLQRRTALEAARTGQAALSAPKDAQGSGLDRLVLLATQIRDHLVKTLQLGTQNIPYAELAEDKKKPAPATPGPGGAGGLGGAFSGLASAMSGLAGAAGMVRNQFMALAGMMRPFVEAFSPGTVMQFDMALRDLTATVGMVVQPVLAEMTAVAREFGSILLPVAKQLAPMFREAAQIVGSFASIALGNLEALIAPLMDLAGVALDLLKALRPVIEASQMIGRIFASLLGVQLQLFSGVLALAVEAMKPLWQLMGALKPVFEAIGVIVRALGAALRSLLGGLAGQGDEMAEFIDAVSRAMRELAKTMVLAAAAFARWLGFDSFVGDLEKALKPARQDNRGVAAPLSARMGTDIAGFGRTVAEMAALAGGKVKTRESEEADWRNATLAALKDLKKTDDLKRFLSDQFDALAKKIGEALQGKAWEGVKKVATAGTDPLGVSEAATDPFGVGRAAMRLGRRMLGR